LGYLYEHGQGVARDMQAAAFWYKQAAKLGYPAAQNNVAVMYETGHGVMLDYGEAFQYFSAAAASGDGFAAERLGRLYEHGLGTKRNLAEAYRWYYAAAQSGNGDADAQEDAKENMNRLQLVLTPKQVAEAQGRALRAVRRAAKAAAGVKP
ncbi:MAG TPA: tetratricopeptide repeat protein, partial [bacterium]|nr:tetratricopeptide repeat protein [bacterium]